MNHHSLLIFALSPSLLASIPTAHSFDVPVVPRAASRYSRYGGGGYATASVSGPTVFPSLAPVAPLRAEASSSEDNNHDDDESLSPNTKKVRTMASFLVTQMLGKAMLEASKEKSKMSEEDALALLETLQSASEAKVAKDKVSTAWQAAEEAVEEKLLTEAEEPSSASSSSSPDITTMPKEDILEVAAASTKVEAMEIPSIEENAKEDAVPPPVSVDTVQKEKFQRSLLAAKIQNDAKEKMASRAPTLKASEDTETPVVKSLSQESGIMVQKEKFQRSLLAATIQNAAAASKSKTASSMISPEPVLAEEKVASPPRAATTTDESSSSSSTSSLPSMAPRIPDIISKDFGKPLEVTSSNVPPLREASMPQRSQESSSSSTSSSTV